MNSDVTIDDRKCAGHALCSIIAPDVFEVNDSGKAILIGPVTETNRDEVREAVAECPAKALKMVSDG